MIKRGMKDLRDIEKLINPECPGCQALLKVILEHQQEIIKLKQRVSDLEARLAKNSRNSSKPPSSDGLDKPSLKSLRPKSKRKPGGQKGHTGETLKMKDNPEHTIKYRPSNCERCGHSLDGVSEREVERRQVHDVVVPKIEATEHQVETVGCPYCGYSNAAEFPEDITAPVQYGPHLKSIGVYLLQYQLLPYERTGELIEDLFSVPISTGTLANMVSDCSGRVGDTVEQIHETIKGSGIVHFDESGVSVNGDLQWLHVAGTEKATFYDIHPKRGSEAMDDMNILPGFEGRAIHDFWKPYLGYMCDHGLCNGHLLRELTFIHEQWGQRWAKRLGLLLIEIKDMVDEAKAVSNSLSKDQIESFEERYEKILKAGERVNPPPAKQAGKKKRGRPKKSKARNLLERFQGYPKEILAFMYDFRVPFDNNLAERDIRMIKLKLKISGTFRSAMGGKAFCRIRSYISTARKNSLNVIEAIHNAFTGQPFLILSQESSVK